MSYSEQINSMSYTGTQSDSTGQQKTHRHSRAHSTATQQPQPASDNNGDAPDAKVSSYSDVAGENTNVRDAEKSEMTPQQLQSGYVDDNGDSSDPSQ